MSLTQDGRVGQLITPLGKDVLVLQRFDGFEGLSELFEFHVDALSEQEDIDFDKAIGRSHTIKLATYQDKTRVIDGILTEAHWVEQVHDHHRYRLVLRPWFALLGYKADSRTFLNKNVKEILQDVFTRSGFSDYQFKTTADYDAIPYCVQYRETDLAFCSRLMEHYGIYYFFQHSEGKHTMVLADSRASHEANPDISKLPYLPVGVRGLREQQRIGAWSSRRRFRTGKVKLNDYDFTKPPKNLQATNEAAANYSHSKLEVSDWRGKYNEKDKGEQFAKIRLEAEQALDQRRHGQGDCPSAFPGSLVSFEQHPTSSQNAEYLIVRSHHRFGTQSYRTATGGGSGSYIGGSGEPESYSGNYEFQPSDCPYRSQATTEKPRIYGACVAKVVANTGDDGEEISTDQYGQVRVQFFWDSAQGSYWARVVQPWGGNQWGGQFIPRVGMEVLVEFEQGDPDYPVVVGCLYNGNNMYPYDLPGNKTQSGVKSNSSKGGNGYNEFMFEDSKGGEFIRMHAELDHLVTINRHQTGSVGAAGTGDQTWTVTGNRSWTIQMGNDTTDVQLGNQTITIDVGTQTVDAMQGITLTVCMGVSTISITPASISIMAPEINLAGDSAINILAPTVNIGSVLNTPELNAGAATVSGIPV